MERGGRGFRQQSSAPFRGWQPATRFHTACAVGYGLSPFGLAPPPCVAIRSDTSGFPRSTRRHHFPRRAPAGRGAGRATVVPAYNGNGHASDVGCAVAGDRGFAGQALYNLEGQVRPARPLPSLCSAPSHRSMNPPTPSTAAFTSINCCRALTAWLSSRPSAARPAAPLKWAPVQPIPRRRVSAQLDFAPGDFTLAGPLRRQDTVARPS